MRRVPIWRGCFFRSARNQRKTEKGHFRKFTTGSCTRTKVQTVAIHNVLCLHIVRAIGELETQAHINMDMDPAGNTYIEQRTVKRLQYRPLVLAYVWHVHVPS